MRRKTGRAARADAVLRPHCWRAVARAWQAAGCGGGAMPPPERAAVQKQSAGPAGAG
jgi:hypothetical protein